MTERHCGEIHGQTGVCCELAPGHVENHRGAFGQVSAQWPVSASAATSKPDAMTERAQALEALSRCVFHQDKPPARACRECLDRTALVAQVVAVFDAVPPPPPVGSPTTIMLDRDAELRRELRAHLDSLVITSDNIGDIRRGMFMPWDSSWNGWVRDETAARESTPVEPAGASEPPSEAAQAHAYLSWLLVHAAPQCEPLPDLMGLCTQIDNLLTGLQGEPEPCVWRETRDHGLTVYTPSCRPEFVTDTPLVTEYVVCPHCKAPLTVER